MKSAKRRKTARPNGKGYIPPLPESIDEPWEPYVIDAKRNLILGDLHIPFHSVVAVEAALRYGDKFNPHAILFNGDVFDLYELSRFDKRPTLSKVENELSKGKELFTHVRRRFPNAKLFFKLGNHDARWELYLCRIAPMLAIEPVLQAWREPAGIIENRVTVIEHQRPVMIGNLPVLHGDELGGSSPVNPARGAFMKAKHTVMVHHHHQTSNHTDTNLWHDETACWSVGALCGLTPPYARTNRWNWGFATVTVKNGGDFDVENLRISKDGEVRKS